MLKRSDTLLLVFAQQWEKAKLFPFFLPDQKQTGLSAKPVGIVLILQNHCMNFNSKRSEAGFSFIQLTKRRQFNLSAVNTVYAKP